MTNRFKRALEQRRPQLGMWLGLASSYSAEVCATAGFDWLLIDGEHAPNDIRSVLAQLQVLAAYDAQPVVRPVSADAHLIKQLLDIGAQTLLVPMVETERQATELVRATRYPSQGIRGVGAALARASRWNSIPGYLAGAEEGLCLIVQIESALGLDNVEAIAGIAGVDGVFVGPADLAASLGHLGEPRAPRVEQAIQNCISRVTAAGKPVGILAPDLESAKAYRAAGCTFVAIGSDISLLLQGGRALVRGFRD